MVIFTIIFLSTLFLLLCLKISIHFRIKMISTQIEIEISVPKVFFKRKFNLPGETPNKYQRLDTLIKKLKIKQNWYFVYDEVKKISLHFLSKSHLKGTSWQTTIGLEDAALTGTLTGTIWSWKTTILGSISHIVKMNDLPEINVTPHFNLNCFETDFKCILSFRIGNLIRAGIHFMYLTFRLYRMSKITTNTSHDFKTLEK